GILDNGGCSGDSEFKGVEEKTEGTKEETGDGLYDSDSFDDEGNAYFGEALVVVRNDEMAELVMDLGKVKIQLHDGSSFILEDVRWVESRTRKKNCVYTLEAKVITFGVQKHGGSKQVGLKQLGSKQVGFKQLGPGVETGFHGVQDEKRVWFKVELQGS
ncbi:hypothetical protein Tco_0063751, partial [Tanacetum coccineum]